MLQQLILWVWEPENLEKILKFDAKALFEAIIWLFFKENNRGTVSDCVSCNDIKVEHIGEIGIKSCFFI